MQITQSSLLRELQKKLYWYIKFFNLFGQRFFFSFYIIKHSCILDIGKNWITSICAGRGINWNNHWRQCALYFGFNLLNHQVAFLAGEVGKEMSSPDFFVQHQFWKLITCSLYDLKKGSETKALFLRFVNVVRFREICFHTAEMKCPSPKFLDMEDAASQTDILIPRMWYEIFLQFPRSDRSRR